MADNAQHSPEFTLGKIGGKWKMPILWRLNIHGVLRYSQLKSDLGVISHKMLSQQLKELERDDLIIRTMYPVVPPKVEYSLTARGRATLPAIEAICKLNLTLDPSTTCEESYISPTPA